MASGRREREPRAHEGTMQWGLIAHGAGVLAHAISSTHSELHALRSGLAYLFGVIAERGTRESKHGGALVKVRRFSQARLIVCGRKKAA